MNSIPNRFMSPPLLAAALAALLAANIPASAGPGAHGPNGEHLDAPAEVRSLATLPRLEAQSDAFELVAELRANELAVVVDRYQTNEPVLGATLEVESGTLKAAASFRAEQGDYAVTDAPLLKALAAPGEHGLVFTLVAGKESDLLDGTLRNAGGGGAAAAAAAAASDTHARGRTAWTSAGVGALALFAAAAVWWRQRRREPGKLDGDL